MSTKFVEENYKNDLDQILVPGDEVVMVASGYAHSITIRKGTYLGVRKELDWRTKEVTDDISSVVCEYEATYYHYHLPYGNPDRYKAENREERTKNVKTNLYLGRVYKLATPAWEMSV